MFSYNSQSYSSKGELYTTGVGTVPTTETTAFTVGSTESDRKMLSVMTHIVVDFDFTIGSLTQVDLVFYFGDTDADLYQEQSEATTAGVSVVSPRVHRLDSTGKGTISVPLTHPVVRVTVNGATTATGSALSLSARLITKP